MFFSFVRCLKQRVAKFDMGSQPLAHHGALIDANTKVVLTVSDNIPALSFVAECFMDSYLILNLTWPNHLQSLPFSLHSRSFVAWSWSLSGRRFEPTRADIITPELSAQSVLAINKLWAVAHIMRMLSVARSRATAGIPLQETTYITKKLQAQAFRDCDYNEQTILKYPFVMQYADFADMQYREAADEIILKAKLADDFLAKTELIRLAYFAELKHIREPDLIRPLLEKFERESFTNSYV